MMIIFLFAFFIRLITVVLAWHYGSLQVWEYEIIADNILNGTGYQFEHLGVIHHVFGPPLYSFLTSLVYFITSHNQLALAVIQAFLSSLACIFIFKIGCRLFDAKTALLAFLMTALHPGLIIYATKLHAFNVDMPLLILVVMLLFKAYDRMSIAYFSLFGAVFGLCLLSRSTVFLFLFMAFILLLFRSNQKKRLASYFALSSIIALLVVSPWLVRNYMLLGRSVFIQKAGEVFWRGNNPNATGTAYASDDRPMIDSAPEEFIRKIYTSGEVEQDRLFWNAAFEFIKRNPIRFIELTAKKFYYFWWFSPYSGVLYPVLYLSVYKILYLVIIFLAIPGTIFALNSGEKKSIEGTYLLMLFFFTISLSQSFFYVEGRHRLAIEPLLLIFTANGIIHIRDRIKQCLKTKT